MKTKEIHISDYNYPLPEERIARFPLPQRDSSKLLVYRHGEISEDTFRSLPSYLPEGALMVFNNTRVVQARLHFHKSTGAAIEVFILEPALPAEYQENFAARGCCEWYCLVGNLKKWKEGTLLRTLTVEGRQVELRATRCAQSQATASGDEAGRAGAHATSQLVRFEWDGGFTFSELLEAVGELPIPPYLNRKTEESDKVTYQTVYSKIEGSVAAPTAGLHFTPAVLGPAPSVP